MPRPKALNCPPPSLSPNPQCYEEEPLVKMSGHYLDKGTPLPKELLLNMIRSKNLNSGLLNLRQVFFGSFDLEVHTSGVTVDTKSVWSKLREEVTRIPNSSGGNGAASFGHIMGGYDCGYYGYLWSEVFSADMFTIFKQSGDLYSPTVGARYRSCILEVSHVNWREHAGGATVHVSGGGVLRTYVSGGGVILLMTNLWQGFDHLLPPSQPGGTQDGDVMVRNFLARDLDKNAFLVSNGLQ